jgi:hypothetical protein
MRLFRRNDDDKDRGGATVLERPGTDPADSSRELPELLGEISALSERQAGAPDRDAERRLLRLRHLAGLRLSGGNGNGGAPGYPDAGAANLPAGDPLPEFSPSELTPELVRAAILRDGCVLVRGLVDRERALAFADSIDRAFAERERAEAGDAAGNGLYEEFEPEPPHSIPPDQRTWIQAGGGVLAADSPRLAAEMLAMFDDAGVTRMVRGYLGEHPLLSLEKTTLRKASPEVGGAWHQDGRFMGDVRALNLWLSLSRCGDESPGLDIVPRRLDDIVSTTTDEAVLDIQVSQAKAEEAAGDTPIVRPIFEPGDALFFDDLFLHKTGSDPSMPKPRFAIESWFFGGSAFPAEYGPLAV